MVITQWPYDNYHEEQERHYRELEEAERLKLDYDSDDDDLGFGRGSSKRKNNSGGYMSGSDDEKLEDAVAARSNSDRRDTYFERPAELPSIKQAVKNLSLVDFEKEAQG
eukprot:4403525-Ditylum_brightwellii.AAC.1